MTGVAGPIAAWWLALTVIGWAAVPLAYRLFPTLPDRGLTFARPLGLLVTAYLYWTGGMAGFVPNSRAGALFVVAALAGLAAWLGAPDREALVAFLRARRRLVFGTEALFLAALALWALYRATNPAIETSGGEKYMEMAFIDGVLASPRFPPQDPWLGGFTISYYYFGYLIAAMLVKLTGVAPTVAFNLVVPGTLAMTLVAAFGLGYDLVALDARATRAARAAAGAAAASLLALFGSLEGALEVAYKRGWGPMEFWNWLDIKNLTIGPGSCGEGGNEFASGGWVPTRHIWWWRGSRVIHDNCGEVIHEFPFFSFMLADAHPHLLALPFALMVAGLALAVLAGALDGGDARSLWTPRWLAVPFVVGALGFLNAWDLPTYGFLVVAAYTLRVAVRPLPLRERAADALRFAAWLAALSIVFYLPFHLGFASQVTGLGVVEVRSRLAQWLVHFGLPVTLAATLVALGLRRVDWGGLGLGARAVLVVAAPVAGVAVVWGAWTALVLATGVALASLAALETWRRAADDEGRADGWAVARTFALGCVAVGLLMPLGTEFVFLRDLFNSRMNTVFKLFFQGWTLLAIGGGYAAVAAWRELAPPARAVWAVPAALLVAGSLAYPVGAVYTRTNAFDFRDLSLDGLRWWEGFAPDDLAAVRWLRENAAGNPVVLEAYGGAYEHNGRISMATGLRTVLGWEGHEHQWRGARDEIDPRKADVERAYTTTDEAELRAILDRYNVRYVVLGEPERAKFRLSAADEERLRRAMTPVFESGRLTILERR